MSKPILTDTLTRELREMKEAIKDLQTGAAGPTFDALPDYPADGQEILFQADAANGVIWHLKYRSDSASAYKWEYIGGAPLYAFVNGATSSITSTSYVSASGPDISIPLEGDYYVEMGSSFEMNTTTSSVFISFSGTGVTANDTDALIDSAEAVSHLDSAYTKIRKSAIGTGTLSLNYRVNGGAGIFTKRMISATPIRVG